MTRSSHLGFGLILTCLALAGLLGSVFDVASSIFFIAAGDLQPPVLEVGLLSNDYVGLAGHPAARTIAIAALAVGTLGSLLPWFAVAELGWRLCAHPVISPATGAAFRHLTWALAAWALFQAAASALLLLAWNRYEVETSLNINTNGLLPTIVAIVTAWCIALLIARAVAVACENEAFV
ncbi:hypothetical protein MNQ95_11795 [Pseudoxanthomonas daejeonensis]|uniref:hypothetical protein n=1 Tax=Pseudoxanthomonas daejeonensis TaxID=266062 RepID=UPI001F543B73|nr:hypothetical protein [Pseudoxanthomonas daejeonensis]UNK56825.1 hypothetical protein MNQ95_11795 [Pseudoxanthomonas daejeonensis]